MMYQPEIYGFPKDLGFDQAICQYNYEPYVQFFFPKIVKIICRIQFYKHLN